MMTDYNYISTLMMTAYLLLLTMMTLYHQDL